MTVIATSQPTTAIIVKPRTRGSRKRLKKVSICQSYQRGFAEVKADVGGPQPQSPKLLLLTGSSLDSERGREAMQHCR